MKIISNTTIAFTDQELSVVTLVPQGFPQAEVEKAIADMDRARERGFLHCLAVFLNLDFRGYEYDGLWERAHEERDDLNWGRGQDVTKRYFFRDGKLTPDPEWKPEPPAAEWEAHGLTCRVSENRIGYLCGYVRIPRYHPWHGKDYGQCLETPPCAESYCGHRMESRLEVHGGVTFADAMHDGGWWIGFDCAHAGDAPSPVYVERELKRGGRVYRVDEHYWTLDEVRAETERLAEQVAAQVLA